MTCLGHVRGLVREGPGVVEKEIVQCHGAHSYKRPPAVPQAQKIREQLDDEDVQPQADQRHDAVPDQRSPVAANVSKGPDPVHSVGDQQCKYKPCGGGNDRPC